VEVREAQTSWTEKYKMPGAIGAIDCSHFQILKPSIQNKGDEYINRKAYASFNVQATCNSKDEFTSVDARWPGSVHDSRIFRNSDIYQVLKTTQNLGHYLLGDSGYGIAPWLMTPFDLRTTSLTERAYNRLYAKERVIIERCFGQLKRRFPMMGYIIRVDLKKVSPFIVSAFVLHNVAKFLIDEDFEGGEPLPDEDTAEEIQRIDISSSRIRLEGQRRRREIAQQL
jgi:hypothetical protein